MLPWKNNEGHGQGLHSSVHTDSNITSVALDIFLNKYIHRWYNPYLPDCYKVPMCRDYCINFVHILLDVSYSCVFMSTIYA